MPAKPPTLLSSVSRKSPRTSPLRRLTTQPPSLRTISTYGYTQAKSLVYSKNGSPSEVLSLHSHSISPPHSTLLTLRTLASPLNPADINQIQGTYGDLPPFTTTLGTPQPSAVPGNEAVFEVLARGSGVSKEIQKGDWVIPRRTGLGTWRTHVQVPEEKVVRVEKEGLEGRETAVGAVGVNPVTAWVMLRDFVAPLPVGGGEGRWYVINAANSGVGRMCLQLGRRWGWNCLAVVRGRGDEAGQRELEEELVGLGATRVVREEVFQGKGFGDVVMEWTRGGREEVLLGLNCVGGESASAMARVLSPGGTMVTYGGMSRAPLRVGAGMMIFRDLRFRGFWVSKWGDEFPERKLEVVREVLDLFRRGELQEGPVVEVPWEWGTGREELMRAVEGTLSGGRGGKGCFVFGET